MKETAVDTNIWRVPLLALRLPWICEVRRQICKSDLFRGYQPSILSTCLSTTRKALARFRKQLQTTNWQRNLLKYLKPRVLLGWRRISPDVPQGEPETQTFREFSRKVCQEWSPFCWPLGCLKVMRTAGRLLYRRQRVGETHLRHMAAAASCASVLLSTSSYRQPEATFTACEAHVTWRAHFRLDTCRMA